MELGKIILSLLFVLSSHFYYINVNMTIADNRGLPGSKRGQSEMSSMNGKVSKDHISEEDDEKAMALETVAYTNIATCYLKLDNPRKAMEFCSKASVSNPIAWKPYLRKSEAHAMMGNFDASKVFHTIFIPRCMDMYKHRFISKYIHYVFIEIIMYIQGSMSEALKLATDSESKNNVLKEKEKLNLLERSTIASDRLKEKKMFGNIFNDEKKDVKIEKTENSFLDDPLSALQGMASLKPLNLSMASDKKC